MFSANENITLRHHKRRVVEYVESTIPESALDLGTSVMVMQVDCRVPGCVPVETMIVIVFPRNCDEELIPGVKESSIGSSYKAKIMTPLASITKNDVLDALPPGFEGGRKTWESTCLNARDFVLGRIGGLVGLGESEVEVEERRTLVEYLKQCLDDYVENGCVSPDFGKPFPQTMKKEEGEGGKESLENSESTPMDTPMKPDVLQGSLEGTENVVNQRTLHHDGKLNPTKLSSTSATAPIDQILEKRGKSTREANAVQGSSAGNNNFVIGQSSEKHPTSESSVTLPTRVEPLFKSSQSKIDRRGLKKMEKLMKLTSSSDSMLRRLAEREHAPGTRTPGCPCCDPDNLQINLDEVFL